MNKKPLVVNVLTSLDFGGVESRMQLIAKNTNFSKFNHAFCAIGVGGSTQKILKTLGMQSDALGCSVKIPSISAVFTLWRYFKKHKPQVVHLRGAEANFHGAIAARLAGVPVVIAEEIGIPNHSAKARRIFAWAYSYCDCIVAISQAVKDGVIAMNEAHASQIQVVYNPFSPQKFIPLTQRRGSLSLGFVGRLEPVKNPMAAVEAIALLSEKSIKAELHIVGDGSLRSVLEQKIKELDLGTQVYLHGFQENPFTLLETCHFYLQPSLTEGFGLAVCEAMSAGLPVIATARGGVPEIIEHDKTGWLIQEPTAKALAEMIQFANRYNDDELQSIAIKGRDEVLQRFGIQQYLNQLDELYNKFLKTKGI
ncbi:glycosyltransferase [Acinetobacter sp. YH01006]|uniref:glycosyltransferase n=1 Tax=Acinetobacter sp. YH01006 TaxID=2601022 RepID=UPI0015D1410A|nr:glycosyltransferase [Acinetobacter sp. YH01006]